MSLLYDGRNATNSEPEELMSLSDIANTIKEHVTQGEAWLAKAVEEHVPALLAEAERITSNPVVQALEGLVFPPEVEQEIVNMIGVFARLMPKAAAPVEVPVEAAPVAPEVPVEQPPADGTQSAG